MCLNDFIAYHMSTVLGRVPSFRCALTRFLIAFHLPFREKSSDALSIAFAYGYKSKKGAMPSLFDRGTIVNVFLLSRTMKRNAHASQIPQCCNN